MRWWLFCVEFDTDVEAGTFFAGKFVVSMYARSGIQCEQSAHERAYGCPLLRGAGVGGGVSVGFEASGVGYAD